ncbi:Thiol-disulfide isomerase or thioredoxin [Haloechinothrix alba]|uniref:Thiol-disulfide isomerase or thioredoxin n=1 Tax=Haloechinothrix alba TaxID=664784 RepID=A0A238W7J9_9PSEU|nr:redoxin domain-containing protein [Haloechinothrix alba]SNR42163.1 Thiol-disulfide isomerase or thioredoxin [Haloechinothrix alba]
MRHRAGAAGLLTAGLLVLASCGTSTEDDRTDAATGTGDGTQQQDAQQDGEPAGPLRFSAQTVNGEDIRGEDFAGGAAMFWFWTPWCTICQSEAPALAEAHATHGEQVDFVGVAADDDVSAMRDFVTDYELGTFEHINDADREVWRTFGVTRQPAYAFVDPSGEVDVVRGTVGEDELDQRLSDLAES